MKEHIMELLEMLIFAGVCAIIAVTVKAKKESILALTQNYIKKAEIAVQGSNMGAEKKKLVCTWLEAAGVKVNTWLSTAIDKIVKKLNESEAWALTEAGEKNE
ncbi:MAG: hypothetical protein VB058_05720 [Oscillospiraceae bacterium]|nr:hypothetical protein [Oscillospiraceae bacterium]